VALPISMNGAAIMYILIFISVLVVAIIAGSLVLSVRRVRKEKTFTGYTAVPKDEKAAAYILMATGIAIIVISIAEILMLLTGRAVGTPYNFADIPVNLFGLFQIAIPASILGLVLGVATWLVILLYGGRKIASIGLDMLKCRRVILRKNYRTDQPETQKFVSN
jgi:hypothetical protein